jgi:serine/threonine protein kinase
MIVTELVAKGDLETMLHDTSVHLSLTLRMKMARDAALGMNWLHGGTPKFIHRDLKCLARDTPVLLADGSLRLVQDLCAGDRLLGDDGTPRTVSHCTAGIAPLVRVESSLAPPLVCNSIHVLSLKLARWPRVVESGDGNSSTPLVVEFVVASRKRDGTVGSLRVAQRSVASSAAASIERAFAHKAKLRALLRLPSHVEPLASDETIDIAVNDVVDRKQVSERVFEQLRTYGVETPIRFATPPREGAATFSIDDAYRTGWAASAELPPALMRAHESVRWALLAGIVDRASSFDDICVAASLAVDVAFVARSLGVVAQVTRVSERWFRVRLAGGNARRVPVRTGVALSREAACVPLREPLRISALAPGEFFGFELDGNRRFVLGDSFRVTHNTSNLLVDENMRIKVCDFGLSQMLADGEVARDQKCFDAADHQLLTNDGFLFLDDVLARVDWRLCGSAGVVVTDWKGLRAASYDPCTARLVYREPNALAVNAGLQEFVELDAAKAGVSLVATANHEMYVARDGDARHAFEKVQAGKLLLSDGGADASVRLLALASGGGGDDASDDVVSSLAPQLGIDHADASLWLQLFGFWLGDRSLDERMSAVLFNATKLSDHVFLRRAFVSFRLLAVKHGRTVADSDAWWLDNGNFDAVACVLPSAATPLHQCYRVTDARWFAAFVAAERDSWLHSLSRDRVRSVVDGLHRVAGVAATNEGATIVVTGVRQRNELERALVHAGYSVVSTAVAGDGVVWRVSYTESHATPLLRLIDARHETRRGVSWCFDTQSRSGANDGFVMVRRATRRDCAVGPIDDALRASAASGSVGDAGLRQLAALGGQWSALGACRATIQGNSAKGTPLWMAPEVMMFRGFTEKCDIYSFGIVLWEILTRQEPFKEFHSFKEFRDAICKRHVRPVIPDDTLPSLRDLVERCWHPDPTQRPDFTYIVAALDDIIVESAITDNLGRAFWKTHFLKRDPIAWSELLPAFLHYLGVPADAAAAIVSASAAAVAAQQAPNSAAAAAALSAAQSAVSGNLPEFHAVQLSIACLRLLVCDIPNNGGGGAAVDGAQVPIEKFGKVLDCFSPVSGAQVLDEIQALCAETWFHGHVSTPEAQTRLANTPAGCFLVRFSSQEHGSYTISLVTPAGAIRHQRVRHVGNAFLLQNQRYPTLRAVVEQGGHLLNLLIPCPGSMFGSIFSANPHPILGYEEISWSPTNEINQN